MKIVKFEVPFTQVPNNVLFDEELSLKAKGVYAYIQAKPKDWDFATERMTEENKDGQDGIKAGIKELKDAGYLIMVKKADGKVNYKLLLNKRAPKKGVEEQQKPQGENPSKAFSLEGEIPSIKNKEYIYKKEEKSTKSSLPEWLNEKAWNAWVQYRKESKKKLTETTIKMQLKKLENIGIHDHVFVIARSIENGWQSFYPLPPKTKTDKRIIEKEVNKELHENMERNKDMESLNKNIELLKNKFKV